MLSASLGRRRNESELHLSTPLPPRPDNRGKRKVIAANDGTRHTYTVEDEIVVPQRGRTRGSPKLIYFQKVRFDTGKVEYRLTYYKIGVKPGARGRWVFGQYSLFIPAPELSKLLDRARAKGWDGI